VIVRVETRIAAPPEVCFDLARDIGFHAREQEARGEKAIAGRTSGLIELGETVTWRARHFGVWQTLTTKIVAFDRPRHFRDVVVDAGGPRARVHNAFARFAHDHFFEPEGDGTSMRDVLDFAAPLGPLGQLVSWVLLRSHLQELLVARANAIREEAERADRA
jgi:ligand-binding SRPBCC domain-containing protein